MDKLPLEIEKIILNYKDQLDFAEKYDKVVQQLKNHVKYESDSERFSHLSFNGLEIHYYLSLGSDLMVIRRGYRGTHYFHNNEIVYLFN